MAAPLNLCTVTMIGTVPNAEDLTIIKRDGRVL
jgi:hypothetical protein